MSIPRIRSAVILAAGRGERFWPYNVVRQKAAFPIANAPAIRRIVDDLSALGVARIVVVTGHGEASVRAALSDCSSEVTFVRQSSTAGSADAVLTGAVGLDEPFLVVAGDVVTARANLAALLDRFAAEQPNAAALIQPLGDEPSRDWLIAFPDGEHLGGVEGHSRSGEYRLCGVYAFQPAALRYLRDNPGVMLRVPVGGMPPLEVEIAESVQMMIDAGLSVAAVTASGYHVDLDKPWDILEANCRVIEAMSAAGGDNVIASGAKVHDGAEISGRLTLGKNCEIGNRVVVRGDLWLGDGASITNGAIIDGAAVIGAGTKVRDYCQIGGLQRWARGVYGHGAEFGGVALDMVYCYHYCEIDGVVGLNVDFGAATVCGQLRFDDGETTWRVRGRSETPAYSANVAYFGDFSRTGVNAMIMPGRRTGVYSCVGAGVVLYEDLPDRQMVLLKQELVTRPWGPERYGW